MLYLLWHCVSFSPVKFPNSIPQINILCFGYKGQSEKYLVTPEATNSLMSSLVAPNSWQRSYTWISIDIFIDALYIGVVADVMKTHLHACLPKMILGCVNEYPAVDGTKQPRAEQSRLAAGAAWLRLLACGCTREQPQQTDCLPWDARNFKRLLPRHDSVYPPKIK